MSNQEFEQYKVKLLVKDQEKVEQRRLKQKEYYQNNKEKIKFKNRCWQIKQLKQNDPNAFDRYMSWLADKKKCQYLQISQYIKEF